MDPDERLEALVEPLRADVVSGASLVGRMAADVMRRAAIRIPAGSLEELRWGLGDVAMRVLDAQPAMAPLVRLVRDVLASVEQSPTVEDGRHAAASAAEQFRVGLDARARAVAARAAEILPASGMVATHSLSSTVKAALLQGAESATREVLCLESRPMDEGRLLAQALVERGIEVTFAVDAAAHSLVPTCALLLLGADSIGDQGIVNKIGSASMAQAARRAGVPAYVVADETKILPVGFPQAVDDDRPAEEVWEAPTGVSVWNRYFELVPLEDLTGIVTESGVLTPAGLQAMREAMDFPDVLRRWAEGR